MLLKQASKWQSSYWTIKILLSFGIVSVTLFFFFFLHWTKINHHHHHTNILEIFVLYQHLTVTVCLFCLLFFFFGRFIQTIDNVLVDFGSCEMCLKYRTILSFTTVAAAVKTKKKSNKILHHSTKNKITFTLSIVT